MGPVSAKSYAGRALVQTRTRPAERAKQEIDYGRRAKGYIFGAFCPATGEAFTHPYPGRGGAYWVDFLQHVESWIPRTTERVYAIMDNLSSHRTTDVLLFLLAHPRWEMVFQPTYAAYLNLRALVEDPAFTGSCRPALRDLGGDRRCDPRLDGLLECAPSSVCLGQAPPASPTPLTRDCSPAQGSMTYRMHH